MELFLKSKELEGLLTKKDLEIADADEKASRSTLCCSLMFNEKKEGLKQIDDLTKLNKHLIAKGKELQKKMNEQQNQMKNLKL